MLPVICSQPSSLLWTCAIYSIMGDHCFWLAMKCLIQEILYTYFCDIYRGCSKNYALDVLLSAFFWGEVPVCFIHVLQGYFTGTGAIMWLPQCQWSNPEVCGWISHMNPLGIVNNTTMIQSNIHLHAYFNGYTVVRVFNIIWVTFLVTHVNHINA